MQNVEPHENLMSLIQDENTYFVVVVGGFSSGKSAFLQTISNYHMWIETDANFNIEANKINTDEDWKLYILAPPNTRRWDQMWEIIGSHRLWGFIIIADAAHRESFREAKSHIDTLRAFSPVSFVVAANKQDQPNALSSDDFRLATDITPEIPVVPCVATDRESVKRVLLTLLDEVLKAMAEENGYNIE